MKCLNKKKVATHLHNHIHTVVCNLHVTFYFCIELLDYNLVVVLKLPFTFINK